MTSLSLTSCQHACTWQDAPQPVPSVNCQADSSSLLFPVFNGQKAACNQDLSGTDLTTTPSIQWDGVRAGDTYLLMMVDPDASTPCNPSHRYVLHWAAFVTGQDLHETHTFASYRSPHPPSGSPAHRYQLFLFEWEATLGVNHPDFLGHDSQHRGSFDFDRFKTMNGLREPVASFQLLYHN
ncbi:hypothetical protein BaRGS_00033112 [Batillaria attramentaria]|uniref:PEBP-like protein n=1 Tax=Batillaria attramentaria TaxID=370345 RepID=A0ABD0JL62_9CAEN